MNKPCANAKLTNCTGIVTKRGNILCDNCQDEKIAATKHRRDNDLEDLLSRNNQLEKQIIVLKEQLANKIPDNKDELGRWQTKYEQLLAENSTLKEQLNKYQSYCQQLEKDHQRITDALHELQHQNEDLLKQKSAIDVVYEQNKIDLKKLAAEMKQLRQNADDLTAMNQKLEEENARLYKLFSERSKV